MTDLEFSSLISINKVFMYPNSVKLPLSKDLKIFKVKSETTKDTFLLDCDRRGTYELRYKNQLRHSRDFPMIRLEINCPPHQNPDGRILSRNHIHVYKEG